MVKFEGELWGFYRISPNVKLARASSSIAQILINGILGLSLEPRLAILHFAFCTLPPAFESFESPWDRSGSILTGYWCFDDLFLQHRKDSSGSQ